MTKEGFLRTRSRKVLAYVTIGLVAVLAIAITLVFTVDFGRFKNHVESLASNAIQREFRIDGEMHLTLGRNIEFSASDIFLAGTEWGDSKYLARIGHIEASVDTWSLIEGPVLVNSLVVDGVRVNLEENEAGDNNWTSGATDPDAPVKDAPAELTSLPVLPRQIGVSDVVLEYVSPQLNRQLQLVVDRFDERIEDDRIHASVDGNVNGTLASLDVSAGTVDSLVEFRDVEFQVDGQVGEIRFEGSANIADLLDPSRPIATLNLEGPNIEYLIDVLGLERFTTGPLRLEASVLPAGERMQLNVNGEFGEFAMLASGQFADLQQLDNLEFSVSTSGPNMATVTNMLGIQGAPADPFNVMGKVRTSGKALSVEEFTVTIGESQFRFSADFAEFPNPGGAAASVRISGPDIVQFRNLIGLPGVLEGPFSLDADVEPLDEGGAAVSLTGNTANIEFSADGVLSNNPGLVGTSAEVRYWGEDLRTVTRALGIDQAPSYSFDVRSVVELLPDGIRFENGAVTIGPTRLQFDGKVAHDPVSAGTEITFHALIPDLPDLLAGFGVEAQSLPAPELRLGGRMTGKENGLRITDAIVESAGLQARIATDISLPSPMNGSRAGFSITGDSLASLMPDDGQLPVKDSRFDVRGNLTIGGGVARVPDLDIELDHSQLSADIEVGLEPPGDSARVSLTASAPNLNEVSAYIADLSLQGALPAEARAQVGWDGGSLSISELIVEVGEDRLDIRGEIEGPPDFSRSDLSFNLAIADIQELAVLTGRELPSESAKLSFQVLGGDGVVRIEQLDGRLGESDIRGDAQLRPGDVPEIELSLASNRLNLTPYLSPPPDAAEVSGTPADSSKAEQSGARVIPDTPFDFDPLNNMYVEVEIRIDEATARQHVYSDIAVSGGLHEGNLVIEEFEFRNAAGGELSGRLGIEQHSGGAEIFTRVSGSELRFGLPADTPEEFEALPRYTLSLALEGFGNNPRELAASLNGYLKLTAGEGMVRTVAMKMFTNDFLFELLNTVNPFTKSDPYSNHICTAILATVEQGQVEGDPVVVSQSDRLTIIGDTAIDLHIESLDADINTVPRKGLGISLSNLVNPYVKVGGTLANPRLGLDAESTIIEGGAAVATGGLSILAKGLKDRFFSDKDPCGSAVAAAEEQFAILEEKYADQPR